MAEAAARGATQRAIRMRHVHVEFVIALRTVAGTYARHQLRRGARRFELQQFAHEDVPLLLPPLPFVDSCERAQAKAT